MKVLLSIIFTLLISTNLFANFASSFGLGGKTVGMSGAGSVFVQDWTATHYNIAGLANPMLYLPDHKNKKPNVGKNQNSIGMVVNDAKLKIRSKKEASEQLNFSEPKRKKQKGFQTIHDFGIAYLYQSPTMQIELNKTKGQAITNAENATSNLNFSIIQLGAGIDLRKFIKIPYDLPVRFGLSLALGGDGTITNIGDLSEKKYNFKEIGSNTQAFAINLGLAVQLWKDRLSLGFSPGSMSTIKGAVEIYNIQIDEKNPPKVNALVDVASKPAPVIGIMYRHPITSKHTLLVQTSYKSQIDMETDLDLDTTLPFNIKTEQKMFSVNSLAPHTFIFALGYQFLHYRASLDFEYQLWSKIKLNPAKEMYEAPLNYNDVLIVRTGIEAPLNFKKFGKNFWKKAALTARTGYAYVPAYTPEQTGSSNYLDNDKHYLSFGLSHFLKKNYYVKMNTVIDFSFQWQLWRRRTSNKEILDYFDDDSIQTNYSYGGHIFISALSVKWVF